MSRITVVVRVKPESSDSTLKNLLFKDGKSIDITVPSGGRHEFTFDHIFEKDSTQADLFNAHSHLVSEVLDGFNGSIIAYGQTGAGKVKCCLVIPIP
jgi:Microtubule binding